MAVLVSFWADLSWESRYGELAYTCLVYSASLPPVGTSTKETIPLSCRPMYSNPPTATGLMGVLAGLACDPVPLPEQRSSFLPSGLTARALGYQPVGMKPATRLWPRREM